MSRIPAPDVSAALRATVDNMSDEDLRKTAACLSKVAQHALINDMQDALRVCRQLANVLDVEAICRGIELEKVA